ncbi:hypothetical protein OG225_41830 (plasmid) [Nocardia sp. NBC_01377]|uniref:hypothetical protein n=1 Tax=Nocardia sp. NBC_01377 TaxID=2903595 RepID=UPI003254250B
MELMLSARCCQCGGQIVACPDCVMGLPIDPVTGLPPDVEATSSGGYARKKPDPEALARAVAQPLCDGCAAMGGATDTAAQRHRRHIASGMP